MPTPPKTFTLLKNEGRSHMTKAQLEARKKAEQELMTGIPMREHPQVKNNEIAHQEYQKRVKVLKKIGKNDALYENVINRYCLITAECIELEQTKIEFQRQYDKFAELKHELLGNGEMTKSEYYKLLASFAKSVDDVGKAIMARRKMLMDIERENLMTINTVLRSIPKKEAAPSGDEDIRSILGGN